jgi:hypothetical protein
VRWSVGSTVFALVETDEITCAKTESFRGDSSECASQAGFAQIFVFLFFRSYAYYRVSRLDAEGRTRRHDTWRWAAMDMEATPGVRRGRGRQRRVVLISRR